MDELTINVNDNEPEEEDKNLNFSPLSPIVNKKNPDNPIDETRISDMEYFNNILCSMHPNEEKEKDLIDDNKEIKLDIGSSDKNILMNNQNLKNKGHSSSASLKLQINKLIYDSPDKNNLMVNYDLLEKRIHKLREDSYKNRNKEKKFEILSMLNYPNVQRKNSTNNILINNYKRDIYQRNTGRNIPSLLNHLINNTQDQSKYKSSIYSTVNPKNKKPLYNMLTKKKYDDIDEVKAYKNQFKSNIVTKRSTKLVQKNSLINSQRSNLTNDILGNKFYSKRISPVI